jgi:hypothetical protein
MNTLRVPQQGPYGERDPFTGHLHISQKPHKIPLNRKALRKKGSSMFSKKGPLWREREILLQGICITLKNLIKIPLNRKALRKKGPSMFSKNGAPMERERPFYRAFHISKKTHKNSSK